MGKNSNAFVADKRKLVELIRVGKDICSGCDVKFVEGDSIIPNPSGSNRYQYHCGKSLNII